MDGVIKAANQSLPYRGDYSLLFIFKGVHEGFAV